MPSPESAVDLGRKLLGVIDVYVAKLPRDRKFTIGNRLLDRAITVLETVTQAYYSPRNQKAALLASVNIIIEEALNETIKILSNPQQHRRISCFHLTGG